MLLKIAREEGLAAMNMRRVAAELNVSSRLLYHYMRDKDEMIDIMSDAITAQNMPDLSSPDWETRLRNVVMAARRAYGDFPGVPATILARIVSKLTQPHASQVREAVLQALRDAGLSQENVEIAHVQFSVMLFGSLVVKETLNDGGRPASSPSTPSWPSVASTCCCLASSGWQKPTDHPARPVMSASPVWWIPGPHGRAGRRRTHPRPAPSSPPRLPSPPPANPPRCRNHPRTLVQPQLIE